MNDRRIVPSGRANRRVRRASPRPRAAAATLVSITAASLLLVAPGPATALGVAGWGASAGIGGQTQDFDYDGEQLFDPSQLLAGFAGGAWVDLGVGIAVPRIELLYQQRGSKDEFPRTDENGDVVGTATQEFRAHYLSVPVTVKLAKVGGSVTPYLAAGLGAEFLLGSNADSEAIFDRFSAVTLGGHLVTGLEFTKVGVQVRFHRDLTNPYDPPADGTLKEVHNQGFAFLLTMKLGPA